jgi:hypothetical protein
MISILPGELKYKSIFHNWDFSFAALFIHYAFAKNKQGKYCIIWKYDPLLNLYFVRIDEWFE